jgi:hypothetical protein
VGYLQPRASPRDALCITRNETSSVLQSARRLYRYGVDKVSTPEWPPVPQLTAATLLTPPLHNPEKHTPSGEQGARRIGHLGCYQGISEWPMTDGGKCEGRVEQSNTLGLTIFFKPLVLLHAGSNP